MFLFYRMLFTAHAGLTWDELCLVIEEQPWPDGATTGRGGKQVRVTVFEHWIRRRYPHLTLPLPPNVHRLADFTVFTGGQQQHQADTRLLSLCARRPPPERS